MTMTHTRKLLAEALHAQARSLELLARALLIEPEVTAAAITEYTSARRGPHPPGKSQDWTVRHLRGIPGSYKIGRDWCITVEAYRHWGATQATARHESTEVASLVEAALASHRLRAP